MILKQAHVRGSHHVIGLLPCHERPDPLKGPPHRSRVGVLHSRASHIKGIGIGSSAAYISLLLTCKQSMCQLVRFNGHKFL